MTQYIDKVQLTGRNAPLKKQNNFYMSLNIAANSSQQIQVVPSAGKRGVLKMVAAYLPPVSGATSGNQYVLFSSGTTVGSNTNQMQNASGGFSSGIALKSIGVAGMKDFPFTNEHPLVITFQNYTDATQTGNGAYNVIWEEEDM